MVGAGGVVVLELWRVRAGRVREWWGCGGRGWDVRDLRYKMIMALNAADLGDPICEQVAEICAEIAEQHCAEFGHTPQLRTGEIAELATGDPALTWAPSSADTGQRAW